MIAINTASHRSNSPPCHPKRKKRMAPYSNPTFTLPGPFAAINRSFSMSPPRQAVTKSSRNMSQMTGQTETIPKLIIITKVDKTKNLSASGSSHFPRLDTCPVFRAIQPSSQSVQIRKRNKSKARRKAPLWRNRRKRGMKRIRDTVIQLAAVKAREFQSDHTPGLRSHRLRQSSPGGYHIPLGK